jgi:hypothetical protein
MEQELLPPSEHYIYSNRFECGEEEQTTQWPKEKVQKDKQQFTKHTYKAKDKS